jgi:ABC-type uncharacterized transport system substrate-binding protein
MLLVGRLLGGFGVIALVLAAGSSAQAHPHVWVTVRSELIYSAGGLITAVRQEWTFDPGFSAYQTQGLSKAGFPPRRSELEQLAKANAEALSESGYYTRLEADGVKQELGPAREYGMIFKGGQLTFAFVAPLRTPAAARHLTMRVHDPTFLASFTLAKGAVTLINPPQGCTASVSPASVPEQTWVNTLAGALDPITPFPDEQVTISCEEHSAAAALNKAGALVEVTPFFDDRSTPAVDQHTLVRVLGSSVVSLVLIATLWSLWKGLRRTAKPE